MPSLQARLAKAVLRLVWRRRWLRPVIGAAGSRVQGRLPPGVAVESLHAGAVRGEWLSSPTGIPGRTVYYLHGGGFINGSPSEERALTWRMAGAAQAQAFSLDYRLAPRHPYPAAVEDTVAGYRLLLEGGAAAKEMVWCGVSAGGGLALSGLTSLRDQGGPLPAACILLSPFLDLTLAGESFGALARRDLLLRPAGVERAATLYAGAGDRRAASPLFGDLRGLPPLLIITGSDEVLLSDSTRLAERAAKAGVDVTLRVFEGLFHVFPAAEFLPETREALKAVREFAGRVLDH